MELPELMKNLTTEPEVFLSGSRVFKTIGAEIDDIHTDFVWADFDNCTILMIMQFRKIGSLILIEKDSLSAISNQKETSFDSRILLGACDIENQVAARFLAENLSIQKPLYLFSSLKNYSKDTLNAVKDICLDVFCV